MNRESLRTVIGETCLDAEVQRGFASWVTAFAAEARTMVEAKIREDPFFDITYDPYPPGPGDPPLIRRMCESSMTASVGPMASVAGAVAAHVVERLRSIGCNHAVIDNGGDIALFTEEPVTVRILPDPGGVPLGLSASGSLGICSSSGSVGHSVSLGGSDVCTVICRDPVLADACATLLGNLVGSGPDLAYAAETVCSLPGVSGCIACIDGETALCGDLPALVPLERRPGAPKKKGKQGGRAPLLFQ